MNDMSNVAMVTNKDDVQVAMAKLPSWPDGRPSAGQFGPWHSDVSENRKINNIL